jgi:hypothetical protein
MQPSSRMPSRMTPVATTPRDTARRCVVCAAPLPAAWGAPAQADAYPACHAIACRMVVSRRNVMSEANFRHYLGMQVRQRQYILARTAALAAREQAEARENGANWKALRARLPAALGTEPLELQLPTGPRRSRRLPNERRARYRIHLLRVIAEARALPAGRDGVAAASDAATGGPGMAGTLCAFCGGGCCTMGAEHAYLSAATMRRVMDGQPELSDDEVLSAYLSRVAPLTRAGSCINHTAAGCSLPRAMRSDICNRYACEPLASLEAAGRGPQPVQTVLIVRRRQDHWKRANPDLDNAVNACAILSGTGLRRVPLPGPLAWKDRELECGSKPLHAQPSSPILPEQNAARRTGD